MNWISNVAMRCWFYLAYVSIHRLIFLIILLSKALTHSYSIWNLIFIRYISENKINIIAWEKCGFMINCTFWWTYVYHKCKYHKPFQRYVCSYVPISISFFLISMTWIFLSKIVLPDFWKTYSDSIGIPSFYRTAYDLIIYYWISSTSWKLMSSIFKIHHITLFFFSFEANE